MGFIYCGQGPFIFLVLDILASVLGFTFWYGIWWWL